MQTKKMRETKNVFFWQTSNQNHIFFSFFSLFYELFLTLEYCRKISPSFQFCSDRIPGGRQGGIEKKQWPRERVGSNSVGKIAELYNSQNQQAINQYQCYVDRKELSRENVWTNCGGKSTRICQSFIRFSQVLSSMLSTQKVVTLGHGASLNL